jgi:hypothetical protein
MEAEFAAQKLIAPDFCGDARVTLQNAQRQSTNLSTAFVDKGSRCARTFRRRASVTTDDRRRATILRRGIGLPQRGPLAKVRAPEPEH